MGSARTPSYGRTGLSTITDAGGDLIHVATVGDCNRNSGDLEGALMREKDGATPNIAYSNDDTDEDLSAG